MTTGIRLATPADGAQVAAIYAPIVRDTAISFEIEPPTADQMARRIADTLPRFPWLVWDNGSTVLGYVYATSHRARAAYRWSVDTSVYIHESARRQGWGRKLYETLIDLLVLQGFCTAYAGITIPNPASVALHESVGFRAIGVYDRVGYKLGAWHAVGWWGRPLTPYPEAPREPLTMAEAGQSPQWDAALAGRLVQ